MINLNGGQFSDVNTYLLSTLALSAATGQAFDMTDIGKLNRPLGLTPFHLTAIKAMAGICQAQVKGNIVRSQRLSFIPTHSARASDVVIDTSEVTGRSSSASVAPLAEALISALSGATDDSFIRLRGVNTSPFGTSTFWLRETLIPMLSHLGIGAAVEIEQVGWFPDGGGEMTLIVERASKNKRQQKRIMWDHRGDLVTLWAVVMLSSRMNEKIGDQMVRAFNKAISADRLEHTEVEIRRVSSSGPGSGLFLAAEFEHVTAGFEGISYQGMSAAQVAQEAASAMSYYFWSEAAFEPELARALMIPFALSGQHIICTTSELTRSMRVLEELIPYFLPVKVNLTKHSYGGQIEISRTVSTRKK